MTFKFTHFLIPPDPNPHPHVGYVVQFILRILGLWHNSS